MLSHKETCGYERVSGREGLSIQYSGTSSAARWASRLDAASSAPSELGDARLADTMVVYVR